MSDGHFNRAFLPHGDFASGVRTGRAAERAVCLEAFGEVIRQLWPAMDEQDRAAALQKFKALVLSKEK